MDCLTACAITQTDATAVLHCVWVNAEVTADLLKTKYTHIHSYKNATTETSRSHNFAHKNSSLLYTLDTLQLYILLHYNPPQSLSVSYPATLPCTLHLHRCSWNCCSWSRAFHLLRCQAASLRNTHWPVDSAAHREVLRIVDVWEKEGSNLVRFSLYTECEYNQ